MGCDITLSESDEARFWAKVKVRGPDECWEWTAFRDRDGYGLFRLGPRHQRSHRVAYTLRKGPIPPGLVIDHLCRNPWCQNPNCLEAVSIQTNTLRGVGPSAVNATKTHCEHGHEFTKANTGTNSKGGRFCRKCMCVSYRKYRDKNLDAIRQRNRETAAANYAANKDAINQRRQERRAANKDKINRQQREKRITNGDAIRQYEREQRAANGDAHRRRDRAWWAKNREECNRRQNERHARKKAEAAKPK